MFVWILLISGGMILFQMIAYVLHNALRKHAYSNILRILPPKNENFQMKKSDIFHINAQNIDCGYSLEPPRKIMYTPVNPSFTI